jgi:hypothetical protein
MKYTHIRTIVIAMVLALLFGSLLVAASVQKSGF